MAVVPPAETCERLTCSPGKGGPDGLVPRCRRRQEPRRSGDTRWHGRPVFPTDESRPAPAGAGQSQPGTCRLCAMGAQPGAGLQGDAGAG